MMGVITAPLADRFLTGVDSEHTEFRILLIWITIGDSPRIAVA
jgi:hypothetical protein